MGFLFNWTILAISKGSVGGRTSARRNPTRTIPGNQAIEQ
jgi:hypothetical protein